MFFDPVLFYNICLYLRHGRVVDVLALLALIRCLFQDKNNYVAVYRSLKLFVFASVKSVLWQALGYRWLACEFSVHLALYSGERCFTICKLSSCPRIYREVRTRFSDRHEGPLGVHGAHVLERCEQPIRNCKQSSLELDHSGIFARHSSD